MQNPIEPKDDYTTDELYVIYNSIDFDKEHPNIVAYITQTNTEEQKVHSYKESLSKKIRFRMMGYKSETEYLDVVTKNEYIQEKLRVIFTPLNHILGTPYERIENQSERSADRLYKKFLNEELKKIKPTAFEPVDISIVVDSESDLPDKKYTTIQYALYHYYLQKAGIAKWFENNQTKSKGITEAAKQYELNASHFRNLYYKIEKEAARIVPEKMSDIKKAIKLLTQNNHSAALLIAEEELNKAERKM